MGGREHYQALKADGTVAARGANRYGQASVPPGLGNVVAVAAGEYHSLALRADGAVVAWGAGGTNVVGFPPIRPGDLSAPNLGQSIVPADMTNVSAIAAAYYHSLALVADGPPVLTTPLVDRTVAYGTTAYLRIAAVGALPLSYQWRFNGNDIPGSNSPVLQLDNVQFGQAGTYSVVVSNAFGTVTSSSVILGVAPFFISAHPQSQNIYRGATARLSVTPTGQGPFSFQWRFADADIPGANDSTLRLPDAQVNQSGPYSVVVRNPVGSVTSDSANVSIGQVIAWGDGSFGQTNLPPGLTNLAAIAAGVDHSVALKTDGTVVAWGENQIANTVTGQTNVPPGLSNVVAVAAGSRHNLALKADGTVFGWGQNDSGQLTIPPGLTNVVAVAAGGGHSLALRRNGTVAAWGYNDFGQARVPFGLSNVVAIAAGGSYSVALRGDGTVRIWGDNSWGSIQPPAGLSNVAAIAAGWQHCAALKADGTVVSWGANYAGLTNLPARLSNVVAIAAGGQHTLALKTDGSLVTGGSASGSLLAVPPAASNIVAIAAGGAHNLVVVDSVSPSVGSLDSLTTSTSGSYFRQTGLMKQAVRVFNHSSVTYSAVRVVIRGLAPGSFVYNASGTNSQAEPYVQYNQPLAPGLFVDLTIEYFVPDRSIPNVSLTGEVVVPAVPINPSGTVQAITRSLRLTDGTYLIDFSTLTNRTYYIQYSTDLATWATASPPLVGTGTGMQWVDNGPPKTDGNPATETSRFYRVLLAP